MESVKRVLKGRIVKSRDPLMLQASLVLGLWEKVLVELKGDWVKGRTKPISFKGGGLKIGVYHQVWLFEIRLREEQLLSLLNQRLDSTIVKEIKTVLINNH